MFVLRPLEFGEILDTAFRLYFRTWKSLLIIGAISAFPSVLLSGLTQSAAWAGTSNPTNSWFFRAMENALEGNFGDIITVAGVGVIAMMAMLLVWPLVTGSIIALSARVYLNQPTTLQDAFRIAGRSYLPLLGTGLLWVLMLIVALPVFTIAGLVFLAFLTIPAGYIVLYTFFAFRNLAIVVEGAGGGIPALARSARLVKGRFWPLLGLGVVFTMLGGVVSAAINYLVVLPLSLLQVGYAHSALLGWFTAILSGAGIAVIMPFSLVGLTLAYYDTRVRKEGFDLEMLAHSQASGVNPT